MHDIDTFPDENDDPVGVVLQAVSAPAGSTVVVSVTGEIDLGTEGPLLQGLAEALDQPGAVAVVIDLSGVSFFSSSGIAALANAHATAADRRMRLRVVVPAESATYRPLQLTGMTELLAIHPTRAAALAADLPDPAGVGAGDPTTGEDEDPTTAATTSALRDDSG